LNYTEANLGRIFILRLHDGEILHEVLESFAAEKSICSALCFFLGGAEDKANLLSDQKTAMPFQLNL
jgi:predicted DNA-binding protein with PD1-like motif